MREKGIFARWSGETLLKKSRQPRRSPSRRASTIFGAFQLEIRQLQRNRRDQALQIVVSFWSAATCPATSPVGVSWLTLECSR
jgi:hypothetical protein